MGSAAPPGLPTRFPCWCRAVYSWGGETKRDLGFIEGDLIECLNAGDGSWWMGRLRRDKRMMGLFPSNFVQVLDDGFQPASRATSPMPPMNGTSQATSPNPSPQKTKTTFRKPFQAYTRAASPNPAATAREIETRSRGPSPSPSRHPSHLQQPARPTSSHNRNGYDSRCPSPAPSTSYKPYSRGPSPAPSIHPSQDLGSSPPPPAPPPHRVTYIPPLRTTPSPTPSMNDRYPTLSRAPSPAPTTPGQIGHTPSPLRDAMEDVMSSLHGMSLCGTAPPPDRSRSPLNPWSPDAFNEFSRSPSRAKRRPRTSLGIGGRDIDDDFQDDLTYHSQNQSPHRDDDDTPQLSNYVQRMESRLRSMQTQDCSDPDELHLPEGPPPAPPPKNSPYQPKPHSSLNRGTPVSGSTGSDRRLRNRKSAYELGREMLGRTFTTKSSATNSSSGVQSTTTASSTNTQLTGRSVMSGRSVGGFSATSAGSLARRKENGRTTQTRPMSVMDSRPSAFLGTDRRNVGIGRPETPLTGITYHSSHDSGQGATSQAGWTGSVAESAAIFGGLATPKAKKTGFFKKMLESAKTGAASARSSIVVGQGGQSPSPIKSSLPNGVTAIAGGSAARTMGLGGDGATDWVQVRRDVNRSNSLSRNERVERAERCQMMDYPVISPVDELYESVQGDEGGDGLPIEEPTDFQAANLALVDKSARFVNSLPPMTNPKSLAQGYVCRPYRSDVQRLRAIFTWVAEKVAWEEDFEGHVDSRRVIQTKRGCAEEVAVLVMEMCAAMGLHAEVIRGFLKAPGDVLEMDMTLRPNHWWNTVLVDGEWRIMDCSLASPTNPRRGQYSSTGSQAAESWWFLARPTEICYTHIPLRPEQQHMCPPIAHEVLMALPCACPPYFKIGLQMIDYDTSLLRIEKLELVQIQFTVPPDVECVAEVEARAFERDADGDYFENGDIVKKRALAQAEWIGGQKRYTVKALLPGDEGHGVLKIYAGNRGLMHSIKDNPHPLAFALPIIHTGDNPPYEFFLRHPTPHAQRHDLYVAQPQCARLAINNTFVFTVRQHPSSLSVPSPTNGSTSPLPFARPSSAMSMLSTSASGSNSGSSTTGYTQTKPAKLAIQAPSGKILRLMRANGHTVSMGGPDGGEGGDGGAWETIIKVGERGTWRGLVLADRSARWCVFGEWECF